MAAALVLLALLAGIAGTSWGLVEARSQRDRAEQARQAEARPLAGRREVQQIALVARFAHGSAVGATWLA